MGKRRLQEAFEQGMGRDGPGLEFRMELDA
jgi:hypothetical protein